MNTVEVQFTVWENSVIEVFEYSGLATLSPLDVVGSATGSSTSLNVGPVTTTQSNELVFASGYAIGSLTPDSNYTMELQETDPTGGTYLESEDRAAATAGPYSASFASTQNYLWVAQIATFKAAVASGTPICGISGDTTNYIPGSTNDPNSNWASPPSLAVGATTYTDPKFGCTVTRLTDGFNDASTDSYWSGTAWNHGPYLSMVHHYSTMSPMNATDTLVLVESTDGANRIKDTAGNVVVSADTMRTVPMHNGSILWDAADGSVFYYTNGSSMMKGTISGSSVNTTLVHDFSLDAPPRTPYQAVNFMDDADLSQDGRHVVIVGGDTTGSSPENVFVYDFVGDTEGPVYTTTCTGSVDGPSNNCLHKLIQTPDNNVIIQFSGDGTGPEQGNRLWNGTRPLPHIQDSTNHLDAGYDLSGRPVFLAIGNPSVLSGDSNPCPSGGSNGYGLDVQLVSSPNSESCLLDNPDLASEHVGYRGGPLQPWAAVSFFDTAAGGCPPNPNSPEYFNGSTNGTCTDNSVPPVQHNYTLSSALPTASNCGAGSNSACWYRYEDEIVVAKIDATSVYRLARAYSRSDMGPLSSIGLPYGFWADPRAAISRDGKYVIFDSNMAHPGGCPGTPGQPGGPHNGGDCSDVYLIKIQ